MKTVRLTTAQAIVRYLIAQRTVIDGVEVPLFPGVFAIFGHGNVTCLGQALRRRGDELPTWRGQNEQGMALAAVGFAKATRRRQIMVATSSIGPGALNMVTAAGVAHANRLPVLLLAGDTFQSRIPDPVLQQVEHFGDPTITVNDAFKPVIRYWDRITRPEQVLHSLPHAVATMLDPANCGPAFIALPQDVQAEAFDFPERFFERDGARDRPPAGRSSSQLRRAAELIRHAARPLIIAGGGVHYSRRRGRAARRSPSIHNIPVVETMAGKASHARRPPAATPGRSASPGARRRTRSPPRPTSSSPSAPACRTSPPGRGRRSRADARFVGINAAGFDAVKHSPMPVVGDARESARRAGADRSTTGADPTTWTERAARETAGVPRLHRQDRRADRGRRCRRTPRSSARSTASPSPTDYALTAAGGLPRRAQQRLAGEGARHVRLRVRVLVHGLRDLRRVGGEDGAARPRGRSLRRRRLVPDDELRPVLVGAGRAQADRDRVRQRRLRRDRPAAGQPGRGRRSTTCSRTPATASSCASTSPPTPRAMGCEAETVSTIAELEAAFGRARASERTSVIALQTDPSEWTEGGDLLGGRRARRSATGPRCATPRRDGDGKRQRMKKSTEVRV